MSQELTPIEQDKIEKVNIEKYQRVIPIYKYNKTELIDELEKAPNIDAAYEICDKLIKNSLIPEHIKSPSEAYMIIQKGKELGLPPILALENLYYIKGKPCTSINVMLAMAYKSNIILKTVRDYEPVYDVDEKGNKKLVDYITTIKMMRKHPVFGIVENEASFSKKEAIMLGFNEKENWQKQFPNMMWIRTASRLLRRYASDVIFNLYEVTEMADIENINYDIMDDYSVKLR